MKTLALDIDGVIGTIDYQKYGINGSDIIYWNYIKDKLGENRFSEIYEKEWKEGNIKIIDNYVSIFIKNCQEMDIRVIVNSVRDLRLVDCTVKWLNKNFGIGVNEIKILGQDALKVKMGYDYVVDDNPLEAISVPLNTILFLIDAPYNKNVNLKGKKNVFRVKNLQNVERNLNLLYCL